MIYRICSRCGKRIPVGTKCKCVDRRYKEEDKHNKRAGNDKIFYHTKEWEKARELCIKLCNGLDLYSLYVLNCIEYGDVVHHIVPLKECGRLRSDQSNLIYLTNSNHQLIEKEYREGNKKEMQDILQKCISKWRGHKESF